MFCFVMETSTLMSVSLHHFGSFVLVFLLVSSGPCGLLVKSLDVDELPHALIFSSLFKAMSEHGKTNWTTDLKEFKEDMLMKPDHRYIRYIRDVHKKLSRERRSLNGGDNNKINTIRLIKPRGECLEQSKELFMEDVFYNLDQLRDNEQLLKSILLLSFDQHLSAVCYLKVKAQQKDLNQCQRVLCPGLHSTNFTVSGNRRRRENWVEVDISTFLLPILRFQRKNLHLLIKLSCAGDRGIVGDKNKTPIEPAMRSPSLLLYLNDPSKQVHQWSPGKAAQRLVTSANQLDRKEFKPKRRIGGRRRIRRESPPKSKRVEQSLDTGDWRLPDLRPSSEFKTKDCDLYDFRVRFSQLKLDHWIVFPPKYNPKYCKGQCPNPVGSFYGSPVHTMVQNIIYEKLDSSVPRPSCVPSHYRPLTVLIFEKDGSYVSKDFKDMVATKCTCR